MQTTRTRSFLIALAIALVGTMSLRAEGQSTTLYSSIKYRGEQRRNCVTFVDKTKNYRRCDLTYGSLYAGEEWDWFQSSTAPGNRSVIKDLGAHTWFETITVPVIGALPKLKPGEQRHITVDTSGADGAPGAPGIDGRPGVNGASGTNAESRLPDSRGNTGTERISSETSIQRAQHPLIVTPTPQRPRQDGKPKIDPLFVKAVVGHIYAIHIVDDNSDFYALFRVDELLRGDSVLISWKLVDAPPVSDK